MPFHAVGHEIAPNVARHYTEMSDGDDYGQPNIDWDYYLAASHVGQCVAVIARDGEKLIGYSVYTIGNNPRYKHIIEASSDGIFLEKPYRGRLGLKFLTKANEYLSRLGVQETHYIESDETFGRMLRRVGAQSKYKIWSIKNGQ